MPSRDVKLEIDRGKAEDIPHLANVEKNTFLGDMGCLALTEKTLHKLFETFPESFLVAREKTSDQILGYCCFERHKAKHISDPIPYNHDASLYHSSKGEYLYIVGFVIKEKSGTRELRGKGIGSELLRKVQRYVDNEGMSDIYFLLEKNTLYHRTIKFWLNHGFCPTSMIVNDRTITPGKPYWGYVMEKLPLAKAAYDYLLLSSDDAITDIKLRIRGGILWLLGVQREEGNWGERSPWLTGITAYSLVRSYEYHDDEAKSLIRQSLGRAVDWLERSQINGSWDPQLGVWDTALVLRGLLAAAEIDDSLKKQDCIEKGFEWLVKTLEKREKELAPHFEISKYGLGYIAQAYLALDDGNSTAIKNHTWLVDTCLDELDKLIRKRGFETWGDHFNVPEVLQAIVRYKEREAEKKGLQDIREDDRYYDAIIGLMAWLDSTQSEYGSWGGLTWLTSMALKAYIGGLRIRHKRDVAERNGPVDYAIRWLVNQQYLQDFSWFHTPEETVYAILALIGVAQHYRPLPYQVKERVGEKDVTRLKDRLIKTSATTRRDTRHIFAVPSNQKVDEFIRNLFEDMGIKNIAKGLPVAGLDSNLDYIGDKGLVKSYKAGVKLLIKPSDNCIEVQDIKDYVEWIKKQKDGFRWLIFASNVPLSEQAGSLLKGEGQAHNFHIRHYVVP